MPHPNDPSLRSFIEVDPASDFPIQNLPYGVFSTSANPTPRVGVAIGDHVLDLWALEQDSRLDVGPLGVFSGPSLNPFMALGPKVWAKTRARIASMAASTEVTASHRVAPGSRRWSSTESVVPSQRKGSREFKLIIRG